MPFLADVAVLEEIDWAFLRTAVLLVASPAEKEKDDKRDGNHTSDTADYAAHDCADIR